MPRRGVVVDDPRRRYSGTWSPFFDTVSTTRLWARVQRHGFTMVVARLTMSVYDAPRILAMDGRLSCPVYARNAV